MDKIIHLKVSPELHKAIKLQALREGQTMQDYMTKWLEASIPGKNRIDANDEDFRKATRMLNPTDAVIKKRIEKANPGYSAKVEDIAPHANFLDRKTSRLKSKR